MRRPSLQILGRGVDHVLGDAEPFEQHDYVIGEIEFPPLVTVCCTTRKRVVIVVPPFAIAGESDNQVVAALVGEFVVTVAPKVSYRVDGPGSMPDEHRANEDTPHQQARPQLNPSRQIACHPPADDKPG